MNLKPTGFADRLFSRQALLVAVLLAALLAVLFRGALVPGHAVFSNDGPLGVQKAESHAVPETFTGGWEDLNTLGFQTGGALPTISYLLLTIVGPFGFAKIYAPFALLLLGLGAWTFFRQLRLTPTACVLGGLAATLNSGFFSAACWGVASHAITVGMAFFALAALADPTAGRQWLRVMLAGLCVGMGVSEGADIGALFSIYIALFIMYQAFQMGRTRAKNLTFGGVRVAVVAVCAGLIAAQTISVLIGTQIKGVAGTEPESRTKAERWDWATQWSLPKREALNLVVPGLFGYRMDTPLSLPESMQEAYNGGVYWGAVGRDPNWDRYFDSGKQGPPPPGMLRFTGGGIYTGTLVVLIALWAVAQSFRKQDSIFGEGTRRWIRFWAVVGLVSLLLAFGRFAPFYQFLYMLPYFSTIRNPAKFTHLVNWALVILFAYGLHGLYSYYLEKMPAWMTGKSGSWWHKLGGFDQRWVKGTLVALGICLIGWFLYNSSRPRLEAYLQEVGFEPSMSKAIALFSAGQVGWFILFLAGAILLLSLVLGGVFAGPRARWAGILLGVFVLVDLGRANQPWIIIWNYAQKYATNPVLDILRDKPYLQRVAILPFRAPAQYQVMDQLYRIEWAQHQFLFYNIHSLDLIQMPRFPADLLAFEQALQPDGTPATMHRMLRRWELTSTRYLLGAAGFSDLLNQQLDPTSKRFRIAALFNIVPKPGISNPTRLEEMTAVLAQDGQYALFEFTGALPRAGLYTDWQVVTNDAAALDKLSSTNFNPRQTVLVSDPIPPSPGGVKSVTPAEYVSYHPKKIVLRAKAETPSILLLNDRFATQWHVTVDGKPAPLLRCNYIMRGVQVPPGEHLVEFHFKVPLAALYVSLAAILVGLVIAIFLLMNRTQTPAEK